MTTDPPWHALMSTCPVTTTGLPSGLPLSWEEAPDRANQSTHAKENAMLKKLLAAGLLAATIGTISVPAFAQVYVQVAPPSLRHEVVPSPRHGHLWVPGHWAWRGHRHHWVPGHWVVA